jgi:N-acetylglucosaminyldiphosphoundecaprenol N-acetyl-beta-D-mannosaminyltransferase
MSVALYPQKRRRFFGSFIDLLTMDETVSAVEEIIEHREPAQHVVINVAKLAAIQNDPALMRAVNNCAIINVDGQGIVWGARRLGIDVPERVAGIDLFEMLVERAAQRGYRPYFLGATDEIVSKVVEKFQSQYPALKVAGLRNGYFDEQDEPEIADIIRKSNADLLFVGISSPKKEFFLERNLAAMNIPFAMGVGGSFDIIAGKTRRAPVWMQRIGLEWFYRLLNEPRRMWKRYLSSNFKFLVMLTKAKIFGKGRYGCD